MALVTKLLQVMDTAYGGVKPAAAFVYSGFGGPIVDRCRQLGHTNVMEVRFGAICPDPVHYANTRAWMWSRVREYLLDGAIDHTTIRTYGYSSLFLRPFLPPSRLVELPRQIRPLLRRGLRPPLRDHALSRLVFFLFRHYGSIS